MGRYPEMPEALVGLSALSNRRMWLVALFMAFHFPRVCWGALVINEFLPDPAGSDGGREFVELLNGGSEAQSLDGVRLQFGNGAEGPAWVTRWEAPPGLWLEPSARFLIVDRNWLGQPGWNAEAYLGLQNGPDALRLVRGEQVLDMVGYGPLTDQDMMETEPADIAPGMSLARRPDGRDTGNNRSDFVLADGSLI